MSTYRGVLLAAGRGKRLIPLTDTVPKPAVPLLDIPLGALALERLLAATTPVVINTSHLGEKVSEALGRPGVEFTHEDPEPYGSGGTLKSLASSLGARIIVQNCDNLSDLDPGAVLATHELVGAAATIAVVMTSENADFQVAAGWATRLIDRRTENAPGGRYIGTAVIEHSAIDLIPDERPLDLTKGLFAGLADKGELAIHVHDGYELDLGTLERYLEGSLDMLYGRAPRPQLPGEIIEVGEEGRAYIGPGSTCDRASLQAGAIVLAGATVEDGAVVEKSIVWPGETVPSGTHLSHAIAAQGQVLQISQ